MNSIVTILSTIKTVPSESLESERLEFKEYSSVAALHNSKDLAEEVVALSNSGGGTIIVGVRDSSNVFDADWKSQLIGFAKVDLLETAARIKGKVKPELPISLSEVLFEGKSFLIIDVPSGKEVLVTTASGKVYIRDGRSSRPMSPHEIQVAVKSLSSYDWTMDLVAESASILLDEVDVEEGRQDFLQRRQIAEELDTSGFLEAIGATRNGSVTRAGLLFFGKASEINRELGLIEFRFSWKTNSGVLLRNDVWTSNLWSVVKKCKQYFSECNHTHQFVLRGQTYDAPLLDSIAFHEALMNALVHRDYSKDGMVSIDYNFSEIKISSPGEFYGGVSESNIYRHQPRHRNKALAKLMMDFAMVDRAGMGVPRMSLRSLRYGRSFPIFSQASGFVQVTMQAEYLRAGVFVIAADPAQDLGIPALVILNSVYEVGSVSVEKVITQLSKLVDDPWQEVQRAVEKMPYVEFCGTRNDVLIRVVAAYRVMMGVDKAVAVSPVSGRLVNLYTYLKKHGSASNSDITSHLGYKYGTQTSDFLRKTKFVRRVGNGPQAVWTLV